MALEPNQPIGPVADFTANPVGLFSLFLTFCRSQQNVLFESHDREKTPDESLDTIVINPYEAPPSPPSHSSILDPMVVFILAPSEHVHRAVGLPNPPIVAPGKVKWCCTYSSYS